MKDDKVSQSSEPLAMMTHERARKGLITRVILAATVGGVSSTLNAVCNNDTNSGVSSVASIIGSVAGSSAVQYLVEKVVDTNGLSLSKESKIGMAVGVGIGVSSISNALVNSYNSDTDLDLSEVATQTAKHVGMGYGSTIGALKSMGPEDASFWDDDLTLTNTTKTTYDMDNSLAHLAYLKWDD
ncbi:hypothetical protein FXI36_24560 [Escherichia coli]|nr:hypothetical protein [Escherichia coli]